MEGADQHLKRLNLNQLYPLDAILNASSLTEAGRRVRLSQPAMSVALRKLRDQFGDQLVVYAGSERRLTPLAERLRPRIRLLLRELESTFDLRVDFDPRTTQRSFIIAAPEALEIMLLGRVIPVILREAPRIDVRVQPFAHGSVTRAFEKGADLVVVPGRFADGSHERRVLMAETPSCMIWEDHPEIRDEISAEIYLGARHAAVYDPLWPAMHLDPASQDLLARRDIAVRTSLHAALPGLAIGTELVVTASGWLLQHYASMMPLRVIPFPLATTPEPIVMQWPAYQSEDPAHRWLMEHMVRATRWFGQPPVIPSLSSTSA